MGGDKEKAGALAQQGTSELTQSRLIQFLPLAIRLYAIAGKPQEAQARLVEHPQGG